MDTERKKVGWVMAKTVGNPKVIQSNQLQKSPNAIRIFIVVIFFFLTKGNFNLRKSAKLFGSNLGINP